jgi:protein TonB
MSPFGHAAALSSCETLGAQDSASKPGSRAIVLAVVIAAHVALLSAWKMQAASNIGMRHEMSVSFAMAVQAPQLSIPWQKNAAPALVPVAVPEQIAEPAPVAEPVAAVATPAVVPAPAAIAATEPEYTAAYLNNPPPAYPLAARRMGLQGRVVLNVEVLASGACGHISIQTSSGYALLDKAALETVRSWRFVPARQAGNSVDKWFMIPVQFSLRDNAA